MTVMLRALRSTTSRLLRLAAVLATAAQVIVAAAPVADQGTAPSAVAHVEAGGTSVHYTHDEAACPACAAQQLLTSGERREGIAGAVPSTLVAVEASARPASRLLTSANSPRAPPVVI